MSLKCPPFFSMSQPHHPMASCSMPCAHCRDLKAENVLQHSSESWVLCDFGSTTDWSGHYEGANDIMVAEEDVRKYTTPAYRPPEVSSCDYKECIHVSFTAAAALSN